MTTEHYLRRALLDIVVFGDEGNTNTTAAPGEIMGDGVNVWDNATATAEPTVDEGASGGAITDSNALTFWLVMALIIALLIGTCVFCSENKKKRPE